jgi:hypothetical protein
VSSFKRIRCTTCPTIFLSRSQYELSRMFSVLSFVKFLSCMDNDTSYQMAYCGVIDNVAILHWLHIISYASHHDTSWSSWIKPCITCI